MSKGQLSQETRQEQSITRLKNSVRELREIIAEKDVVIAAQEREINELKEKLQDKELQRKQLASYLFKEGRKTNGRKKAGKKAGAAGFHRPTPKDEDVTYETRYFLNKCPMCNNAVNEACETVVKYEEDIALKPKPIIKKYVIGRHWCPHCETFVKSLKIPPISRIGINTLGYILYARYRLRLPQEKIKESLLDLYNFKISEGEISEKLQEAEALFGHDYQAIVLLIHNAKRVYADETGWRMDGKNWWLWVFVTDDGVRYVMEQTRGKGVAEEALGDKEERVIISDGYAAYKNLPGDKQQCWVHLLRVAKAQAPPLYQDLAVLYKKLLLELEKPLDERNKQIFQKSFTDLIEKDYGEASVTSVKKRMHNHANFLFTCLDFENILPENNTAERAIRPQVVMRKIFGGSRSPDGAKAHEVNTSVIETLRKQNPEANFFDLILPLLHKRRSGL
jgi:transposase